MSLKNRKLGRTSDQRKAMLRAMVTYLLENGQIKAKTSDATDEATYANWYKSVYVPTVASEA